MSGWEPGWQPAGDAPQRPPEPNGLPGPATDLSPAEPGWQDQPVRYPNSLLERTGWSPDPHLGRVSECAAEVGCPGGVGPAYATGLGQQARGPGEALVGWLVLTRASLLISDLQQPYSINQPGPLSNSKVSPLAVQPRLNWASGRCPACHETGPTSSEADGSIARRSLTNLLIRISHHTPAQACDRS